MDKPQLGHNFVKFVFSGNPHQQGVSIVATRSHRVPMTYGMVEVVNTRYLS